MDSTVKIKIFAIVFLLNMFTSSVNAFEILLGIEATSQSVWVEELDLGNNEIAMMDSGLNYQPSISVRSSVFYFEKESNWGYHYQLDGATFNINKQEIPGLEDVQDLGTEVKGYSLYAVPVAYYHFNRNEPGKWSYKAGLGVGIGYLKLSGNFRITDTSHPEYNQVKQVDADGFDIAVGVYFEAVFDRHVITVQNYGPTLDDGTYEYLQHNVAMSYRYAFRFSGF